MSAEYASPDKEDSSLEQEILGNAEAESGPQSRHAKSRSRLPIWAYNAPPPHLDRNLHDNKLAQPLKIASVPSVAILPTKDAREISNDDDDDDDDDEPGVSGIDPNDQPVPTRWLMLGYSRVADIPTPLPTKSMTRRWQEHGWSMSPASYPSKTSTHYTTEPGVAGVGKQSDFTQSSGFQVMAVLSLFVMMVLIIEGARYAWGLYLQSKTTKNRDGSPVLLGNEKQLRAYADETD